MTMLNYSHITHSSRVDGPGERAVLFLQGCPLACRGCQNTQLWPEKGGSEWSPLGLAHRLLYANPKRVTISGGEPFAQPEALSILLGWLKSIEPDVHIIVYTGFTIEHIWQDIVATQRDGVNMLGHIDVLVDGPFILEQDSPFMQYRGSANQRPIDVRATFAQAKRPLSFNRTPVPVVLDWDTPRIEITPQGEAYMTVGLADQLWPGEAQATRRCGQTR